MEFPALVYRSASVYQLVRNEAEHAAALKDGWFATVPEAVAPKLGEVNTPRDEPRDDPEPIRAALEREAAELGLQYSPLIGDAKLAERIAAAKAKG